MSPDLAADKRAEAPTYGASARASGGAREVWEAMCPPVRARNAADAQPNRARQLAVRLLEWEARRRNKVEPPARIDVDARILVVQPDHLGGVLAATPAFRLIKESLPTCELTVLAGPWGADAAEHCPAVDRVRTCRFPAFDRSRSSTGIAGRLLDKLAPYERVLSEASKLVPDRYDLALVLVPDFWSAAVTALAAVPLRIGFAGDGTDQFLTHSRTLVRAPIGKAAREVTPEHASAAQLRLASDVVRLAGRAAPDGFDQRMAYEPSAQDRADAIRLWRAHDLDEAPSVVALHPAPGGPSKRWANERFAIVADHIAGKLGGRVVITGGPADVADARAIAARVTRGAVVLAGQSSFGALAALLERCRFALGTDNGALHLATARGVPTIRLFGPTDEGVWSGWTGRDQDDLPTVSLVSPRACSPCHRLDVPDWRVAVPGAGETYPCMADLSVETVIDAVERMWRVTSERVRRER